jgi:lipid A ethanolaminephosphotransferase
MFLSQPFKLTRLQLLAFTALWLSLLPNAAHLKSYITSTTITDAWARIPFVFTGWLFVFTVGLMWLVLTAWPWRGRWLQVWCAFMVVLAAALGYYSLSLGMQFNASMLVNVLQTHPAEALELLTWQSLIWLAFVGILPAVLIMRVQLRPTEPWQQALKKTVWLVLISVSATALGFYTQYSSMASARRNHTAQFKAPAPVNLFAAAASVAAEKLKTPTVLSIIGGDARPMHPEPKS